MSRRPLALLAEGWWVLIPTAALVALAVLLVQAPAGDPSSAARTGDGRTVMSYGFDLESCSVDPAEFTPSGMPRDGLPTLIDPDTIDAAEIERRNREERGKLLVPGDRVAGLVVGGEARAYPLRLLRWHEVVNDTLGGVPILISYNPLCDSVVAAERVSKDEKLVFASSGLVLDSNLLLFDRRENPSASSLWSQIDARSLCGPLAGAQLRLLPAELTSWEQWRKRHPDTRAHAIAYDVWTTADPNPGEEAPMKIRITRTGGAQSR